MAILHESARLFGPKQRERYAGLIRVAAEMVGAEPFCPGSHARDEFGVGVRSFHVELAARRRGAASHLLYYLPADGPADAGGIIILRILHEAMEPSRHLGAELL
jgi:toxin ParE1/3/4